MKKTFEIITTEGDTFNVYSTEDLLAKFQEAKANQTEFLVWENGIFEIEDMQGILLSEDTKTEAVN